MAERYRTRRFVALGHDFECRTTDRALRDDLDRILQPLASHGRASTSYDLVDSELPASPSCQLRYEGVDIARCDTHYQAVEMLLWHVNRQTVALSPGFLLLHGAAAARCSRAVLLPAPTGSGKSTLVAGLIASGLDYLTDEIVAIELTSRKLHPVPKAITLKGGSRQLFPQLRRPSQSKDPLGSDLCQHVDARSIRADCISGVASPALVVFPHFAENMLTKLTEVTPTDAFLNLVQNAFNLEQHGAPGLELLRHLVETIPCYQLTVGDLDDACRVIATLLDTDTDRCEQRSLTDMDTVLLEQAIGAVHVLNAPAALVWSQLQASISVDDIVRNLSAQFGVEPGAMRSDVLGAIDTFCELGLTDTMAPGRQHDE